MLANTKQLEKLGISTASVGVFGLLTENNQGLSVVQIASSLNLPRPTIYGYLDELISKGLVKKGIKEKSSLYFGESKELIEVLFEEKIDELEEIKSNIHQLWLPEKKQLYKPKFYVYEGKDSYKAILRDILSGKNEIYWYWPIKSMMDLMPEYEQREFHRKRIKKGIPLKVLWPQNSRINKKDRERLFPFNPKESLRELRILPKELNQNIGYGVYGTKVAFISTSSEQYSFIVDSKDLSETLKSQFKFIWKHSKKI